MRFFKLFLFTFLLIFFLILIAFFTRNSISHTVANHYLTEYESELTCLEFNIDLSLNIDITKLCINSPQANFELENTQLQWQLFPQISVTALKVSKLMIKGNTQLFSNKVQKNKTNNYKTLTSEDFSVVLEQAAQLNLSTSIELEKFTYQPFSSLPLSTGDKDHDETNYVGQFSANKDAGYLSINNSQQQHLLSLTLVPTGTSFSAELKTDLALLKVFLADHTLNLPKDINDDLHVNGAFKSKIEWKNQELLLTNEINELSVNSEDIKQNEQLRLDGKLAWKMRLSDGLIHIAFSKHNKINLTYSEERLIELFTELSTTQKISPKITSIVMGILKDNPTNGLVISPRSTLTVNLVDSNVSIAELGIKTTNINQPSKINLTELYFNFGDHQNSKRKQNQVTFSIESYLNMTPLHSVTKHPVHIKAVGHINQFKQGWLVHLTPETLIKLNKVSLTKAEDIDTELTKTNLTAAHIDKGKNTLSINKFVTHLQGDIKITQNGKLALMLNVDNQALSVSLNEIIQLDKLQIKSNIKGSFSDININANVVADDVDVSTVLIEGDVSQPYFELSAKQLLLTDLLALKVNLPVSVKLIDGELDYHLSGQLSDLNELANNDVDLSVSLTRISGEIDRIWVQEVNWQQEFMLTNGHIKTLDDEKNNLNIELIETASPITNLSINTNLNIKLQGKNTRLNVLAKNIEGEILGGSFYIAETAWPINTEHSVNVQLTNIDLEQVLELDKKQGIVVTGKISGQLPIYFDDKSIIIKKGELHNTNNGLIQVMNNPAVEELKASNSQLKLAFGALQNLHYHQLSSDVSMNDDGYMLLETVIKGRNPDLDNDVNLNLNLSYDLLGLLDSMTITERFEERIIKDLQKH